jgi:hypothetical protein
VFDFDYLLHPNVDLTKAEAAELIDKLKEKNGLEDRR